MTSMKKNTRKNLLLLPDTLPGPGPLTTSQKSGNIIRSFD